MKLYLSTHGIEIICETAQDIAYMQDTMNLGYAEISDGVYPHMDANINVPAVYERGWTIEEDKVSNFQPKEKRVVLRLVRKE